MMQIPVAFLIQLLGWSAVWIAVSLVGLWRISGRGSWRAFFLMSGLWCVVNIGIVAWALAAPPATVEIFRRVLLVNVGLDIVYLIGGTIMLATRKPMLSGFGLAVCVQGSALMAFDLAWWHVLRAAA